MKNLQKPFLCIVGSVYIMWVHENIMWLDLYIYINIILWLIETSNIRFNVIKNFFNTILRSLTDSRR